MSDADPFAAHRSYLFGLAYRMLGSASDVEDILQDAYVRYAAAPRDDVRVQRAYLTTVVTRLCLDRLKAARSTREHYLGPWLPEPVLTTNTADDPQSAAERHDSIQLAFLVMLETLTPQERAVFLLREVFGYPYPEIATILQTSQANCRQVFHRAKAQLAAQQPRYAASPAQQRQLVERFLAAVEQGDVAALQRVLAADVRMWADSGGKSPAPRHPVAGRATIAKLMPIFLANTRQLVANDWNALHTAIAIVNDEPAILVYLCGQLDTVMICSVAGEGIAELRLIRNPDKLVYLREQLRTGGVER
jgi:RNA polymerase sigma-70 factor (TIGR02957 family)